MILDIRTPAAPTLAGTFDGDGYTHDVQCVNYRGPDAEHAGREICFASNEDTVTIVDVTNKAAPRMLSRTPYAGSGYTHQGWLTADQRFFAFSDEADELQNGHNARTRFLDVADLDAPRMALVFDSPAPSIDHNIYIKGNRLYQANYTSGLRILDISGLPNQVSQVALFDVTPGNDAKGFSGAWSVYPYFPSGTLIVSSVEGGLFVVRSTSGGGGGGNAYSARADVDGNGRVDGMDLILLAQSFGLTPADAGFRSKADVNDDGRVDGTDLALLVASFGSTA